MRNNLMVKSDAAKRTGVRPADGIDTYELDFRLERRLPGSHATIERAN